MELKEVLEKVVLALKEAGVPYALTGGIAVDFYGFPRATHDIDVIATLTEENFPRLARSLEKRGFEVDRREIALALEKGNRFVAQLGPHRVDFWLAKTDGQKKELDRARIVRILGAKMRIVAPEDLVLHKLDAGRGRDYDDALGVLVRQKGKLQKKYLMERAVVLGLDRPLRDLLKEAGYAPEGRVEHTGKCKFCESTNIVKAGIHYVGGRRQRWLCKDCGRIFIR
ncbi:MAG: hypothetical protein QW567_02665 [Candidatus Hadarchaeales archaeon]